MKMTSKMKLTTPKAFTPPELIVSTALVKVNRSCMVCEDTIPLCWDIQYFMSLVNTKALKTVIKNFFECFILSYIARILARILTNFWQVHAMPTCVAFYNLKVLQWHWVMKDFMRRYLVTGYCIKYRQNQW